ncbi:MAG TPA: hypothetical protein VFU43_06495 [Streptosporangiaceae bacterium]|nr:hypothetical protein [Streptosporangiaceae bacterium]
MPDQAGRLPDLEAELRTLGRELDLPPAPDLTAAVRRRLEDGGAPDRGAHGRGITWPGWRSGRRRVRVGWRARWRVAVCVVLALLAVLAVTPSGRAVITNVFRFAGIELREEPGRSGPVSPPVSPSASGPATGPPTGERPMSLEQARRQVRFPILVPAPFGAPEQVVVRDGGRVASLVYRRTPYGEVRVDEFEGRLDSIFFTKFVQAEDVTEVRVAGRKALWVAGPHELVYVRPDGTTNVADARLTTGNTLIWDTGRVALRLEGAFGKERAIAIATATRP